MSILGLKYGIVGVPVSVKETLGYIVNITNEVTNCDLSIYHTCKATPGRNSEIILSMIFGTWKG